MPWMRDHNSGSLFQRKTGRGRGRWVAVVTLRDGRRASRTAKTREEAKAALAELLRLRDARAPITRNIRLGDYLERWVSDVRGIAPSTRRKHESAIRVHLIPELGHIRLSELRTTDVDRALASAKGLGPQSRRHLRATLRRALADAVRDGLTTRNVGGLAHAPKLEHRERTILDANQARILIESTRNTVYGPLWTLLVTTGLRISEALGLSWSDVDFGGTNGAAHDNGQGFGGVLAAPGAGGTVGTGDRLHRERSGGAVRNGPCITVRRQLARENGEWVHRPPKTAKGRRTIPLTPLGVEALRAQRTQQREWMADYYEKSRSPKTPAHYGAPQLDAPSSDDMRARSRWEVWSHRDGEREAQAAWTATEPPIMDRRLDNPSAGANVVVRSRGTQVGSSGDLRPLLRVPPAYPHPIDTLVFTTSRGKPLHETNTLAALHKALAEAGLPRVTQHDLRHSCATLLYSMGVPLETIADILGHSTPRITAELYRHRVPELATAAAERMQEALG